MDRTIDTPYARLRSVSIAENGQNSRIEHVRPGIIYLSGNLDEGAVEISNKRPQKRPWCVKVVAQSTRCILVNESEEDTKIRIMSSVPPEFLNQGASEYVSYEQEIILDDFTFTFHRKQIANNIDVTLDLPAELKPEHTKDNPLEGVIALHNKGDERYVQFHIKIAGLNVGYYHVDEANPKIIRGRDYSLPLALFHSAHKPLPAGDRYIEVYATADEYPHEESADFQAIHVLPFYEHEVSFEDQL